MDEHEPKHEPKHRVPDDQPIIAEVVPDDPRYVDPNVYANPHATQSNGSWKYLALGCGLSLLLVVLLIVGGAYWAYRNVNRFAAKGVVTVAREVVKESQLPVEQQEQVMTRIEELGDDFAEGEVTLVELQEVAENVVTDKKVIVSSVVYFIENQLLDEAPVDDETRAEIQRMAQRIGRGVIEETLDPEDFKPLLDDLIVQTDDGPQLNPDLSEEDIKGLLEKAREIVDQAEVPDEPYEMEFLDEVDRAIDEVLEK